MSEELLTVNELAELLRVNRDTIIKKQNNGTLKIPCLRIGKKIIRFKLSDVQKFLNGEV
jgi:excisionase family DNA binding protein